MWMQLLFQIVVGKKKKNNQWVVLCIRGPDSGGYGLRCLVVDLRRVPMEYKQIPCIYVVVNDVCFNIFIFK
jgi:3-deoxy-D-manno-octulosonic acid (KDO) 8-phosphate synthase